MKHNNPCGASISESASKAFENPKFTKEYYQLLCDNFRSPHIWKWDKETGWKLRKTIFDLINKNDQLDSAAKWSGNQKRI